MTKKYHFEDFAPGRTWEIDGPTVSRDEIVEVIGAEAIEVEDNGVDGNQEPTG